MINYVKNIKNPALKCFVQLFPIFVLFFVFKDFGKEIGQVVSLSVLSTASFLSPVFRFAGEYLMGVLVFIAMWSVCVFSKTINIEKDLNVVIFWKNIAHAALISLFCYCVLFIIDSFNVMNEMPELTHQEAKPLAKVTLVACVSVFLSVIGHIFLFALFSDIKKKQENPSDIYS